VDIELLERALALPEDERAALADALLESLDADAPESVVDDALAAEIQRRVASIRAGTAVTMPWPEARRRICAAAGLGADA
jgi:putative addiction module component (TIGR02574 family)